MRPSRQRVVGVALDGSGFLVPRPEGLLLTACSWASSKWEHLAGDPVIVRASAGRFGDERIDDMDDSQLIDRRANLESSSR